jgi:hypothetical protein
MAVNKAGQSLWPLLSYPKYSIHAKFPATRCPRWSPDGVQFVAFGRSHIETEPSFADSISVLMQGCDIHAQHDAVLGALSTGVF